MFIWARVKLRRNPGGERMESERESEPETWRMTAQPPTTFIVLRCHLRSGMAPPQSHPTPLYEEWKSCRGGALNFVNRNDNINISDATIVVVHGQHRRRRRIGTSARTQRWRQWFLSQGTFIMAIWSQFYTSRFMFTPRRSHDIPINLCVPHYCHMATNNPGKY